ncbi:alpha/beta hydrolase family protein [Cellulomonas soli]|uniref:Lipase n=1 Tax=Cellulomonas soli TaxID=931535 RepID=A0A512PCA3_9CELL|nr:alpha/beta hydrolase [Cellulomonas soli]NYI58405.1 acetyl esterase/lipase [Cellulomonas soli]GEP68827.1 lipase [Cellulomonas soli]
MTIATAPASPWTTIAYGTHPDQVTEVTVPEGATGPLPLVVLLHGGVWREPHDRVHIRPLAAALAATGVVVANTEYRRVGGAGGWPQTFEDVALATDTVPDLIGSAGLAQVDPEAVVLVGHSAGGHLALWATVRHLVPAGAPGHRAAPLPVAGVVPLAGVVALSSLQRTGPDGDSVERLMGGDPGSVPGRYAAGDPTLLGAPSCRTVLVHGAQDEAVPVGTARDYAAARPGVDLVELAGTGHFEVIDPTSTAWPAVLGAVCAALGVTAGGDPEGGGRRADGGRRQPAEPERT